MKLITRTKRVTSNYYHLTPKKKLYRTPLEHLMMLYNQIPGNLKFLKHKAFARKINSQEDVEKRYRKSATNEDS